MSEPHDYNDRKESSLIATTRNTEACDVTIYHMNTLISHSIFHCIFAHISSGCNMTLRQKSVRMREGDDAFFVFRTFTNKNF